MTKLDKIKLQGSVDALKGHIQQLLWNIGTNADEVQQTTNGVFIDLRASVNNIAASLAELQEALHDLQQLDPRHK